MPRPANPRLAHELASAAADVLEETGIEAFTLKAVAERVGYSPATVYLYYKNRDDLLHGAVERGMGEFIASVQKADRGGSGRERLRETSRAFVEWGLRNPAMYRLMFEQRLPRPAEGEELERRRRGWGMQRSMLAEILTDEPEARGPKDLDVAANMVFVGLHGTVSLAISGRLWGPNLPEDDLLAKSLAHVDGMVAEWADAWGLA